MNPILRNILAVVFAWLIGSVVNMGLITVSGSIIPLPNGIDQTSMEGLKAGMHLFEPKHFIFPFLAHALGTLVGAYLVAKLVLKHKINFAYGIGAFFLMGGIINVIMLPSPTWFTVLDLVVAYLPMAWLGGKLGSR